MNNLKNTYNKLEYRFNAKELDPETGNYYYGARYYNPKISVWLSVDPLAHKYPSLSPYVFTGNNPIMLVDPDGMRIAPRTDDTDEMLINLFKQFTDGDQGMAEMLFSVRRVSEENNNQKVNYYEAKRKFRTKRGFSRHAEKLGIDLSGSELDEAYGLHKLLRKRKVTEIAFIEIGSETGITEDVGSPRTGGKAFNDVLDLLSAGPINEQDLDEIFSENSFGGEEINNDALFFNDRKISLNKTEGIILIRSDPTMNVESETDLLRQTIDDFE